MTITGNTAGLSKTVLERLAELNNYQISDGLAVDSILAEQLAQLTAVIGREIAVYANRQGNIIAVGIGDDHTVALEELHFRRGENRLSGVRCIHTHPSGWGDLSAVDLAALELLRFDAMVALGVNPDGSLNTVGFAWGTVGGSKPVSVVYENIAALPDQNFSREAQQREKLLSGALLQKTKSAQEKAILVAVEIKSENMAWEKRFRGAGSIGQNRRTACFAKSSAEKRRAGPGNIYRPR